MMCGVK